MPNQNALRNILFCPKDFEFDIDKRRKMSYNIPRAERGVRRGSIAQLGEHLPYKQRVTGSSPVVPTIFILMKTLKALKWPGSSVGLECQPVTLEVEGSSPFRVAKFALVAQLVEQQTENLRVGGSTPPQGTIPECGSSSVGRAPPCQGGGRESESRLPLHFFRRYSQAVRRRSAKPLFPSSILGGASKFNPLQGYKIVTPS